MMFGELEALERRAVACKHWRWMPGMMTCGGWRVIAISEGRSVCAKYDFVVISPEHDAIPDLTDPATVGCLLALVRETWGDPSVGIFRSALGQEWCVLIQKGGLQGFHAPIEAPALVAALEGAP
jgi:hypothetical protein